MLTDILEIAPLTKTIEKFIIKKVVSSSKKNKKEDNMYAFFNK